MQDEHFLRDWNQSHERFAQGIDAGIDALRGALTGFILGAVFGGALLASIQATPSSPTTAAQPASVRVNPTRAALA
jgi:hypothetical protein